MHNYRKSFGYPPLVRRDLEIYRMIDGTNKNIGRIGFCVALLAAGGYYLYKKVNHLTRVCEKLKETGK